MTKLEALRARSTRAGVLLDFDGTLSEIVDRPDLARAVPGAREALAALVPRYALVAVITGRRAAEVQDLVQIDGVRFVGLYGIEASSQPLSSHVRRLVEEAAAGEPGVRVEDKDATMAVHYRQAHDSEGARSRLRAALEPIAAGAKLEVVEGKMVLELVPPGRQLKGEAVEGLVGEHGLEAALFAGDDVGDLGAFRSLDRLGARGLLVVKVAVEGSETPAEVLRSADVVVKGPAGTVELLRSLADPE